MCKTMKSSCGSSQGMILRGSAPSKSLIFRLLLRHFSNLFLDALPERLFRDFMTTFCEKVRFWSPMAAQPGSKINPWGAHFRKKIDFWVTLLMSQSVLEPTRRSKVAQDASKIAPRGQKVDPRAPQGWFFMDFEVILGPLFHVFLTYFQKCVKLWNRAVAAARAWF